MSMSERYGDEAEEVRSILTDRSLKVDERVEQILFYFLGGAPSETVEIVGARCPVEKIEAYGLAIELDANGNAATVRSPYGLQPID